MVKALSFPSANCRSNSFSSYNGSIGTGDIFKNKGTHKYFFYFQILKRNTKQIKPTGQMKRKTRNSLSNLNGYYMKDFGSVLSCCMVLYKKTIYMKFVKEQKYLII